MDVLAGEVWVARSRVGAVLGSPGGRVALARRGEEVVGLAAVLPPQPGDRFWGLAVVGELVELAWLPELRAADAILRMVALALEGEPERWILYHVADPQRRAERESARQYRRRVLRRLGPLGFVPTPTDYRELDRRRGALFLVRVGARVAGDLRRSFFARLRGGARGPRVAVVVANWGLRNLVRLDLERHGLPVVAVAASPRELEDVDVVVTDLPSQRAPVTVRITSGGELREEGGTLLVPDTELHLLPDLIREWTGAWPKSSSTVW